jgi:hypothetical protein
METFQALMGVLQTNLGSFESAEKVYKRTEELARLFNIKHLSPNNMAMLYAVGAQMYMVGGLPEKAIELLSKYVDVCVDGFFPVALRGDDFFDKVDRWLVQNTDVIPRSEEVIKESMMNDVVLSPVFEPLRDYPKYRTVMKRLKGFIEGD